MYVVWVILNLVWLLLFLVTINMWPNPWVPLIILALYTWWGCDAY